MKILFFLIFQIILINSFFWFSKVNAEDDCSTYTLSDNYELYKKRLNCICKEYEYNPTIVTLEDNYPKIVSNEELEELVWPDKKVIEDLKKKLNDANIPSNTNKYSTCSISTLKTQDKVDECIKNQEKESKQNIENNKKREEFNKPIKEKEEALRKKMQLLTTEYSLEKTKELHVWNMNSIYKCWLLSTQKKSLLLIKNDLIKQNPTLGKKIEWKIDSEVQKLEYISDSNWCTKSKSKSSVQKLTLLKQATYQTCKYISYLEYLKEYNKSIPNIIEPNKWHYTPLEIVKNQEQKVWELDEEIKYTYRIFPLAFHAYWEYENNITAHFLLELLKDDYITLRESLHKALNPINQVVYKIVNAMKK